jgi:S-adenosylhomocysteine hydrolase
MTFSYDIADLNLAGRGVERINWAFDIDVLTPEQRRYLASWREGT